MSLVETARPDHEDRARAVARADEHMLGARRTVHEVPSAQRALLAVDDRDALAMEDQEVLLDRLAVIEAVPLAGLHDLDVHASVRPRRVLALAVEGDRPAGTPVGP